MSAGGFLESRGSLVYVGSFLLRKPPGELEMVMLELAANKRFFLKIFEQLTGRYRSQAYCWRPRQ